MPKNTKSSRPRPGADRILPGAGIIRISHAFARASAVLALVVASAGAFAFSAPDARVASKEPPEGWWVGTVEVGAIPLTLWLELESEGETWRARGVSPDQSPDEFSASKADVTGRRVRVEFAALGAVLEAELAEDRRSLEGLWRQRGRAARVTLAWQAERPVRRRPQQPTPPFPYRTEEVRFAGGAPGVVLAGTLTLPEAGRPRPAVILVSGSGPQNRDEEILGHRPFAVIADALARRGIASLRYDDRGAFASTGDYASATTEDFARDAEAAVRFLASRPEIDRRAIGIVGHSEGGLAAVLVAARTSKPAFLVVLAGPGVSGRELVPRQVELVLEAAGASRASARLQKTFLARTLALVTREDLSSREIGERLQALFRAAGSGLDAETRVTAWSALGMARTSAWWRFFLAYDPRSDLRRVRVPVLSLFGENDRQVCPKQNAPVYERAFAESGHRRSRVLVLPGLNHLFQTCASGSPALYGQIEETISPLVLDTMAQWIEEVVRRPRR